MKKFLPVALGAIMCLLSTSCEDEEISRPKINWHPTLGAILSDSPNMVSIESEKDHKSGQLQRSSDNFSTTNLTGGDYLLWTCTDSSGFDVMIDKSGPDDTFAKSLFNGAITSYRSESKFYIANPQNAHGKFTVTASRISSGEGYIYINSASSHLEGEQHRASSNFAFGPYQKYRVECPDRIHFKIMHDISVASDRVIYDDVSDDNYIEMDSDNPSTDLYIADVTNANSAFTVTFKPVIEAGLTDWMGKISDSKRLCELSIPGTHDSGTGVVGAGMSKCQNFNFDRQLNDGIRFFDVRLNEDLQIAHGPTKTGQYLSDALRMFNEFLQLHPKEVILMSVKSENGDASDEFFDYVKANAGNSSGGGSGRIVQTNVIPTLGEVRGKIVLFRRMPLASGYDHFGIDCHSYWPDDTSGEADIDGGYKLYVEDRYFSADETEHDTEEKTRLVKEALDRACANSEADKKTMFLIFNSVAGRVTHTPWDYAWGEGDAIDPYMNKSLYDNLNDMVNKYGSHLRTGVILMDFYSGEGGDAFELAKRIIDFNY